MVKMTFEQVVSVTGGGLLRAGAKGFVGVSIDTRTLKPGQLFVAIVGERFDGNRFAPEASARGAAGVVISDRRFAPQTGTLVMVDDTRRALGRIAARYRTGLRTRVVAVTGSNGKTTTRSMLACILRARHHVVEARGSYNNDIGVPLTLFDLEPNTEFGVVELEMNQPGGTRNLAAICRPEVGVVTNVHDTHLESMKDRDGVAREKAELLEELPPDGTAVLNCDDERVMEIGRKYASCRVLTYGTEREADVFSSRIRDLGLEGIELLLQDEHPVRLSTPGRHNAANCLAACAAAHALGVGFDAMPSALGAFEAPPMRLRVMKLGSDITLIDDAYNANPQSVHAALDVLCGHECSGHRLVFLGDMLELGPMSLQAHSSMGKHVASCVDRAVFVGPLGEHAVAVTIKSGVGAGKLRAYRSSTEVLPDLIDMIRPGDTILVKGSRAMKMEVITHAIVERYGG